MSKHTPGPWFRFPQMNLCIESHDGNVALCNLARASEADAQLIAASPEMLSLLQRIHADADSQYEGGSNNGQAKISAELYQELCEFVASFKS